MCLSSSILTKIKSFQGTCSLQLNNLFFVIDIKISQHWYESKGRPYMFEICSDSMCWTNKYVLSLGDHTPTMFSWCTHQHVLPWVFFFLADSCCFFRKAMEQLVGPSGTGLEDFFIGSFWGYRGSLDGKRKSFEFWTNCGMFFFLSLTWFQRVWTYGEWLGRCFLIWHNEDQWNDWTPTD